MLLSIPFGSDKRQGIVEKMILHSHTRNTTVGLHVSRNVSDKDPDDFDYNGILCF